MVCEGTETKEQVEILRDYGCDIFQGYYFSKPLTKDQLIIFVKDRNV
ncbi:MAG: EAL domain-containing protein [Campylobacterales bacterium]|nr:EAL domain-containing protein [Campylobacterales bacterium]